MAALRASRLVWSAMRATAWTILPISSDWRSNSATILADSRLPSAESRTPLMRVSISTVVALRERLQLAHFLQRTLRPDVGRVGSLLDLVDGRTGLLRSGGRLLGAGGDRVHRLFEFHDRAVRLGDGAGHLIGRGGELFSHRLGSGERAGPGLLLGHLLGGQTALSGILFGMPVGLCLRRNGCTPLRRKAIRSQTPNRRGRPVHFAG